MIRTCQRQSRLNRFACCGANLWLEIRGDRQDLRLRSNHCGDRLCVPCGIARARIITDNILRHCQPIHLRFITLTLRHSPTSLRDQLDRLYRSFQALRRRRSFSAAVTGGAAFCEIKVSERTGRWHVHLHCLVQGTFIDQHALSREWLAVTGDSSIVDIRSVPDKERVTSYVVKYVTKPADATVFADPEKLDELCVSLKRRRLCMTWGSWRGFRLEEVQQDGHTWQAVGNLWHLFSQARDGDALALRWVDAIALKWPDLSLIDTAARPP